MNIQNDNDVLNSKRITTQQAAEYLGFPVRNIQEGLQEGLFPFGIAYKKREWVYLISPERLVRYKHGDDIKNDTLSI